MKKKKEILSVHKEQHENKQPTYLEEGRTISIDKLPDCELKKLLISIVQDPSQSKICVIAFLNKRNNSWVALAGYPHVFDLKPRDVLEAITSYDGLELQWRCDAIRSRDGILVAGELLPKEVAEILFPEWVNKKYKE